LADFNTILNNFLIIGRDLLLEGHPVGKISRYDKNAPNQQEKKMGFKEFHI